MALSDQSLEGIVVSVLAVNKFGLEKARGLLPALRMAGLTRPAGVVGEDLCTLTVRLARAGYNRGLLTEMMAGRLLTLMAAVDQGRFTMLDSLVSSGDRDRALAILCEVHGIGPQVAANAWKLLRDP
jgi:hypothetical protein